MLIPILTGSAFGMALAAAGVHQPYVIVSQLTLRNFHMLESFLAAAASSAILVTLFQAAGYIDIQPRSFSRLGPLSLGGNVLGGLLQGVGMALSGSCAGTVFVQVGAGIPSGLLSLAGGLLGGILWTGAIRPAIQRCSVVPEKRKAGDDSGSNNNNNNDDDNDFALSLPSVLGLSRGNTLVLLETLFIAIVSAAVFSSSAKTSGLVHPVIGGALIGGAQLLSIVARRTLLGTSAAFEEAGSCFWTAAAAAAEGAHSPKPPSYSGMLFVAGMAAGARVLSLAAPEAVRAAPGPVHAHPAMSVLGGVLLAVGSRMAGGCTSGHGISGISLQSVSSFVTVAAMFAGGIAAARILY
ncbi:hypothetical protein BX600DRAFT_544031 [Xylariales sp. PMI_506]|nr:hypothetical protein BX600DRAFT_544031 [Xylariales sp. PMI_506]